MIVCLESRNKTDAAKASTSKGKTILQWRDNFPTIAIIISAASMFCNLVAH